MPTNPVEKEYRQDPVPPAEPPAATRPPVNPSFGGSYLLIALAAFVVIVAALYLTIGVDRDGAPDVVVNEQSAPATEGSGEATGGVTVENNNQANDGAAATDDQTTAATEQPAEEEPAATE